MEISHTYRILKTTNKRCLVVVYNESQRGIGWSARDDEQQALDRAISHYRRAFNRTPLRFHIHDNQTGVVNKGIVN